MVDHTYCELNLTGIIDGPYAITTMFLRTGDNELLTRFTIIQQDRVGLANNKALLDLGCGVDWFGDVVVLKHHERFPRLFEDIDEDEVDEVIEALIKFAH